MKSFNLNRIEHFIYSPSCLHETTSGSVIDDIILILGDFSEPIGRYFGLVLIIL